MLRVTALTRYLLLRTLHRKKFLTQRDLDQVYRQEPVWYGWEYPNQLMVIVICFTYACISPVVLIFGSVFFLMSLVVYKSKVFAVRMKILSEYATIIISFHHPHLITHSTTSPLRNALIFNFYRTSTLCVHSRL